MTDKEGEIHRQRLDKRSTKSISDAQVVRKIKLCEL